MGSPTRTVEERLKHFVAQVEVLRGRRMFVDGLPQLTLRLGVGPSGDTLIDGPDEEDFRSFMVDFRPFTLDREGVFFNGIANLMHQRLTDQELKDANSANRQGWIRAFEGMARYSLVSQSTGVVTSYVAKDFFDLVVNGKMFHHDKGKAAEFEALPSKYKVLAEFAVKELAIESAYVLHLEANLIRRALAGSHVSLL